jgi:hypothetical protein
MFESDGDLPRPGPRRPAVDPSGRGLHFRAIRSAQPGNRDGKPVASQARSSIRQEPAGRTPEPPTGYTDVVTDADEPAHDTDDRASHPALAAVDAARVSRRDTDSSVDICKNWALTGRKRSDGLR